MSEIELPEWCQLVDSMVARICERRHWDLDEVKALLAEGED